MNYRGKLVAFLTYKNEIIKRSTGIKYINREDITEVNRWKDTVCQRIYETIKNNIINHGAFGVSTNTCAWCIKHLEGCDNCGYGNRHLKCMYRYSLYMKYRGDATILLTNHKYKEIIRKIDTLY